MSNKLRPGATNYVKCQGLHKATSAPIVSVSSATAFIYLTGDATRTPLANSSITLTVVSGEPDAYEGNFPSTVSLANATSYTICATIVADAITSGPKDEIVMASRE